MINVKRVIVAGIVIDIVSIIVPGIIYSLFSWVFELEPTGIWKLTPKNMALPKHYGWWLFVVLGNTFLSVYVVFLYAVLYNSTPGDGIKKGIMYGLLMYPICILISMFAVYIYL